MSFSWFIPIKPNITEKKTALQIFNGVYESEKVNP